jgi:hypothetical protein
VYELLEAGSKIPSGISSLDLGLPEGLLNGDGTFNGDSIASHDLDLDINYLEGVGLMGAARILQRQSQQYWLFEYVRRLREKHPEKTFRALVLGCVDPERQQYAIYVYELGLEHRYTSPAGRLQAGIQLRLKVDYVAPRSGILSFVRTV